MTIDPRERAYFERLKALLTEMEELKADLAALKKECVDDGGLTRERVSDLAAVAKLEVMDQAKRAAKDMQRKRRDELAGQLSMLDEPKKREPVTRAKPKEKPPEPPHDPETGEIVEGEGETIDLTPQPGDREAFDAYADLRAEAKAAEPEPDLAAARRADFADDLEIPDFARRVHPDCPVGQVKEAVE